MKEILKKIFLSKRAKALYWSSGMMILSGLIDISANVFDNIDDKNLFTIAFGLFLAQCSKALHNHLTNKNNNGKKSNGHSLQ